MNNIVVITCGTYSRVASCISLVNNLAKANVRVHIISNPHHLELFANSGATFHALHSSLLIPIQSPLSRQIGLSFLPKLLAQECLATYDEILDRLMKIKPKGIIFDSFNLAAYFAAYKLSIPTIRIWSTIPCDDQHNYLIESETQSIYRPLSSIENREWFLSKLGTFFNEVLASEPDFNAALILPTQQNLIFGLERELSYGDKFDTSYNFIGPASIRSELTHHNRSSKLNFLFVNGSLFLPNIKFLNLCCKLADDFNANLLIATKYLHNIEARLENMNSKVKIVPWINQSNEIGNFDVVFHHGGFNTAMEAARSAVLQVIEPISYEHWQIASSCQQCGHSLIISSATQDYKKICEQLSTLLNSLNHKESSHSLTSFSEVNNLILKSL